MENEVANWYYRYTIAGARYTHDLREDCPFTLLFLKTIIESRWLWCDTSGLADADRKRAEIYQEMAFWCELHCSSRYQFIATDLTTHLKWFDYNYTFANYIRGIIFQDDADAMQFKLMFSESLAGT